MVSFSKLTRPTGLAILLACVCYPGPAGLRTDALSARSERMPADFRTPRARAHIVQQRERLRKHFRLVLRDMAKRDVSHLTAAAGANRRERMRDLREYSRRGRFPVNLENPGRTLPYIRDSLGTLCAMAYLMDKGGASETVNRLARENNHVYMNDIKSGPVIAWLKAHGITRAEAARIQPRYDHMRRRYTIHPRMRADAHGDGFDSGYFRRGLLTRAIHVRRDLLRLEPGSYPGAHTTLFMGATDGLYARRAGEHRLLWKAPTKAPVIHTPIVIRGLIYANIRGHGTGVWDAATGRFIRMFPVPKGPAGSPLVIRRGTELIVPGNDQKLYFFQAQTGKVNRSIALTASAVGSPLFSAGNVIVTSRREIAAFRTENNTYIWRAKTEAPLVHEPVKLGNRLFAPAGTRVIILNASNGGRLGILDAKDDVRRIRMTGHNTLAVLTEAGRILVFNTNDNKLITTAAPRLTYANLLPSLDGLPTGRFIRKPSRIVNRRFITGISARGNVRAHPLRAGARGWSLTLEGSLAGAAVLPGGRRFVLTDTRGYLYLVTREGRIIMKIKQAPGFTSRPVTAN